MEKSRKDAKSPSFLHADFADPADLFELFPAED